MLPVDCIEPSPYQARTAFDEPEIAALAVSILQNGLLQPISVRRVGIRKYQLVAGERRLRACRLAKLDKVPAILADYDDSESAALGLLENLQRSQLDPFDTARGIKEVIRLCDAPNDFTFAYDLDLSIEEKIKAIVTKIYGGKDVAFTANAQKQIRQMNALGFDKLLGGNKYITMAIPLSVLLAIVVWIVMEKTMFGYELKATGFNKNAAKYCGMQEKRNTILTLVIAGALAGLGGAVDILGIYDRYMWTALTNMGFDAIIPSMLTGITDVGASAFTITPERAKRVLFSKPYYISGLSILVRAEDKDKIKSVKDIENCTICAQIGTSGSMRAAKVPGATVRNFNTINDAYLELGNKGCKAVITDRPVTAYFLAARPETAKTYYHLPEVLNSESFGFPVSKNKPELMKAIDTAIDKARANGEFTKMYVKWFGEEPPKELLK